jgi:hypothetical protein
MAELASYLVRPLVVILRDSQDSARPGYTMQDVLNGMANNRQVRRTIFAIAALLRCFVRQNASARGFLHRSAAQDTKLCPRQ